MLIIVAVVCAGTVFVLGMVLGQQLSRRERNISDREIAALRRQRDALARALDIRHPR